MRRARTASAQSTGITSRSGLAFHTLSIEASIGSDATNRWNCSTPLASSVPDSASAFIAHQGWGQSPPAAGAPIMLPMPPTFWDIHDIQSPRAASGVGMPMPAGCPASSCRPEPWGA